MSKRKFEKLFKYNYHKTQFFALSLSIALGYLLSILYQQNLLGKKTLALNELFASFVAEGLNDVWFYLSLLPVILFVIIPQIKKGSFQRIQPYNPSISKKTTISVVASVSAISLFTLLTMSYLFSLFVLLSLIVGSYSVLFFIGQKVFTIDSPMDEIQRMRIEDL